MAGYSPEISYPGVIAARSVNYTNSRGVSPGVASLVCVEQPNAPSETGDLIFGDSQTRIKIPSCRVDNIKTHVGGGGLRMWTVCLKDRRWLWQGYGAIFGSYNQLDPNNKLIPWTIRSPEELARLCLDLMGEVGYFLNMPPGLSRAWGLNIDSFLTVGNRFPPTGVNPPVNWNGEPPAQALGQIAQMFGCEVAYDVIDDIVKVVPIGVGNNLPDGHIRQFGQSIKKVAVPDGIVVVGDRTKIQMRVPLEPVGLDYDGSWRLLHDLTYAPLLDAAKAQYRVTFDSVELDDNDGLLVAGDWFLTINGRLNSYSNVAGQTLNDVSAGLITTVQANGALTGVVTIEAQVAGQPTLLVTGVQNGFDFPLEATLNPARRQDGGSMQVQLIRAAAVGRRGFDASSLDFTDVVSTDQLTWQAANQLARDTVLRCYRIRNVDVSGGGPINVPGYGPIQRRQQLVPTDTMVDQIVPESPNANFFRVDQILNPNAVLDVDGAQLPFSEDFIENFYNGYSRDKPAVVYGSFNEAESGVQYQNQFEGNTAGDQRVFIPFSIDPIWQVVTFQRPVYRWAGRGRLIPSNLTLETGFYLRESESNQYLAYTQSRQLRPSGQTQFFEVSRHPDVQLGIIGKYNFRRSNVLLTGTGNVQKTDISFKTQTSTSKIPAGFEWSVTLDGVEYVYTNLADDTPLIIATYFKNNIPDNANVFLTLMTAAPIKLAPPVQNPATAMPGAGLSAGVWYFVVTAETALGETTPSNEVAVTTTVTNGRVLISWQAVPNALNYNVYWSSTSGAYSNRALVGDTAPATWSILTQYVVDDRVSLSGSIYRCRIGNLGQTPPNDVFWTRVSAVDAARLEFLWAGVCTLPQAPPAVNTATIPQHTAVLRFTGKINGLNFGLDATCDDIDPVLHSVDVDTVRIANSDQRDFVSTLTEATILESDPIFRANYYLDGMMLKYQIKLQNTVVYNTIMPIACDGAIAQVTWEVGDGKTVQTTASINCEHSDWVPPAPERRRAEALVGLIGDSNGLGRQQNVMIVSQYSPNPPDPRNNPYLPRRA